MVGVRYNPKSIIMSAPSVVERCIHYAERFKSFRERLRWREVN